MAEGNWSALPGRALGGSRVPDRLHVDQWQPTENGLVHAERWVGE